MFASLSKSESGKLESRGIFRGLWICPFTVKITKRKSYLKRKEGVGHV